MPHPIGAYIRAYGGRSRLPTSNQQCNSLLCMRILCHSGGLFSGYHHTFIVNRIFRAPAEKRKKNYNNKMNTNQPRLISYQNISLCKCLCECEMFVYWIWHMYCPSRLLSPVFPWRRWWLQRIEVAQTECRNAAAWVVERPKSNSRFRCYLCRLLPLDDPEASADFRLLPCQQVWWRKTDRKRKGGRGRGPHVLIVYVPNGMNCGDV